MRILIADDDRLNRRLLEATLSQWGFEVVVTEDGQEAWDTLETADGPQLAILDWMMPNLDGPEVCRKMRARQEPRPSYLILLTALGTREDIVGGLQAGADDFISKPFHREELRARVQVGVRTLELQRDLAERERELGVARALMLERERFEAAVGQMSDGIIVLTSDGKIASTNRAACRLLNLRENEAPGMSFEAALERFDVTPTLEEVRAASDRIVELSIARAQTRPPLYLESRWTRLHDATGAPEGAVVTLRDVTDKRLNETLRTNFLMMVSHKVRTPLTVVGGYMDLCRRASAPQLALRMPKIVAVCAQEVRALQDLLLRMLDLKTLSTPQLLAETKPIHVATVIDIVTEDVRARYPTRRIETDVELVGDATHVDVSDGHMEFVLEKLLDNAVKFADKEPAVVKVKVERSGEGFVRCSVTDNGPGIPSEYFDLIFDGFVQVEPRVTGQVPGLGVGLHMAKKVVTTYQGTIDISSELDEGTTVSFTLPAVLGVRRT